MTTRIGLLSALGVLLCSATQLFAQTDYPVPFVNKPLVPETAAPGGRGFILTVNGTGFSAQSVVKWNGSALPTVFVNDTQLTARIAASDIATASTAVVTVVNPGPLSHISNPVTFGITTPEPSIPLAGPVMAADLNGDGIPDLVTFSGSTVYVALGTGGGQFGPAQSYPVSGFPAYIAVGDLDRARKPDLAAAGASGVQIPLITLTISAEFTALGRGKASHTNRNQQLMLESFASGAKGWWFESTRAYQTSLKK